MSGGERIALWSDACGGQNAGWCCPFHRPAPSPQPLPTSPHFRGCIHLIIDVHVPIDPGIVDGVGGGQESLNSYANHQVAPIGGGHGEGGSDAEGREVDPSDIYNGGGGDLFEACQAAAVSVFVQEDLLPLLLLGQGPTADPFSGSGSRPTSDRMVPATFQLQQSVVQLQSPCISEEGDSDDEVDVLPSNTAVAALLQHRAPPAIASISPPAVALASSAREDEGAAGVDGALRTGGPCDPIIIRLCLRLSVPLPESGVTGLLLLAR